MAGRATTRPEVAGQVQLGALHTSAPLWARSVLMACAHELLLGVGSGASAAPQIHFPPGSALCSASLGSSPGPAGSVAHGPGGWRGSPERQQRQWAGFQQEAEGRPAVTCEGQPPARGGQWLKLHSHGLLRPCPPAPKPPQLPLLNGDTLDRTDRELSQQRVAQGGDVHCKSSANDNTEPRGSLRISLNTVPRELLLNWLQGTQERNPIHRSRNGEQSVWDSASLSSSQTLRHHLHDF